MQEEISKMSDEELLSEYSEYSDTTQWYYAKDKIKFEEFERLLKEQLLKRLSKNNIEEFKKKLIKEIEKSTMFIQCESCDDTRKIIDLINNIGKE